MNNLILIDSLLPTILSDCLLKYYSLGVSDMRLLISELEKNNPLKYDSQYSHKFYEYKLKRFLTDVALGMVPSKVWYGQYDANGGYIIVKSSGEILCYHIYDKNQFEEYLVKNTKLDTASSTRHEFGKIYQDEVGSKFIKLNLQVRFK
jgi:type II restriction enzyme